MTTLAELGIGEIGDPVRSPSYDRAGNLIGSRGTKIVGYLHPNAVCIFPPDQSGHNLFVQIANPDGPPKFRDPSVQLLVSGDSLFIRPESLQYPPASPNERLVQEFYSRHPDFLPVNMYQLVRSTLFSLPRRFKESLSNLSFITEMFVYRLSR